MTLGSDLRDSVQTIFRDRWSEVDARIVPETKSIGYGNVGKKLDATILYADIDGSTNLVDQYGAHFCAEVCKAYLRVCAKIIRYHGGEIRAFDGDRIMAVYFGITPNSDAVKSALKINWAVRNIINPAIANQYSSVPYRLKQNCGIDTSTMLAVRAGIRDNSDLVWVGTAANHAAKLNNLSSEFATWITDRVFDRLADDAKFGGSPRRLMWEKRSWTAMNGATIYCSDWTWSFQ